MDRIWVISGAAILLFLAFASCAVNGVGEELAGTVAAPAFSPAAGTYIAAQTVTIATTTPGASIRYTTDGSTPSRTAGTFCSGPVEVSGAVTLKAVAYQTGWTMSAVTSGAYSIEPPVEEPDFSPAPGISLAPRKVSMATATEGAGIRYTTDGSMPSETAGMEYTGPVTIAGTATLKAVAYRSGWTTSPIKTGKYERVGLDSGNHTVAVKGDGTVWSWGHNYDGQLGDGTRTNRSAPAQVPGLSGFVAVACGPNHTIALKSDGTVWSWGNNYSGELGDGTTTNHPAPARVPGLSGVVAVASGAYHVVVVKDDGTVWAWGRNFHGQLGDGTRSDRLAPVRATPVSDAVAVAAGHSHTLILRRDGTVWAFGNNSYGQLGGVTALPGPVPGISEVTAIAAGDMFSLARKSDGTVWGWGENTQGQLGDGTVNSRATPMSVPGLTSVTGVEAGVFHSLAAMAYGTAQAWGHNGQGELGNGMTANSLTPLSAAALGGGIVGVVCGGFSSFAFKSDGTVWAWGENTFGQLGDGTTTNRPAPVQVIW